MRLEDARQLAAAVPPGIDKVAVFLHPSQELVDAALAALQPDWVQTDVRGPRSAALPVGAARIARAAHRTGIARGAGRRLRPSPRFLLESGRSGAAERADWGVAARLAGRGQLVLAGGLDAGNVAEAIAAVRPFGVDVSSGVESSRGVKDPRVIQEFVRAARAAEARLASSSVE